VGIEPHSRRNRGEARVGDVDREYYSAGVNIPRRFPLVMLALAAILSHAPSARADDRPRSGTGIRYLYLIRHGDYRSEGVADDRTQGALTPLGHEQARRVGAWLRALPVHFSTLVSSDFLRARETARDIGKVMGLSPTEDTLIHECTPGSDRADLMRSHPPEEVAACDSNLAAAWARYAIPSPAADTHQLLVCHGNVIRWLVCRALGADTRRWSWMEIGNASVTIIAVRPDGTTRLAMFSDVGHLPIEKQTWTGKGAGWRPPSSPPAMR
jgi:serine/threonine-protein phosphatase PGAM5